MGGNSGSRKGLEWNSGGRLAPGNRLGPPGRRTEGGGLGGLRRLSAENLPSALGASFFSASSASASATSPASSSCERGSDGGSKQAGKASKHTGTASRQADPGSLA